MLIPLGMLVALAIMVFASCYAINGLLKEAAANQQQVIALTARVAALEVLNGKGAEP